LSLNDTVVKLTHQQSNANLNMCDEAYKDLAFEKTLIEINNEQKSTINIESEISNKASHFRENLPRKQENNQQNFQKILLNEKESNYYFFTEFIFLDKAKYDNKREFRKRNSHCLNQSTYNSVFEHSCRNKYSLDSI